MFTKILFWLFFVTPTLAFAAAHGDASFKAKAVLGSVSINGDGGKVVGDLKRSGGMIGGGRFSVKLSDLKTGIDLRDEHMLKALGADKFPSAHFTLFEQPANSGPCLGELTLNGVTKRVEGWVMDLSEDSAVIKGKVKLSDFKIEAPTYKGAGVAEEVEIVVKMKL